MKNLLKILILMAVMTVLLPLNTAFAETLEDTLNNLVGPSQQYNTMVSSAYLRSNDTEDYINPQSGELILTQTDYVLPGRNGLDLELKRMYKSGTADFYKSTVEWSGSTWVDYLDNDFIVSNSYNQGFYEMRYNLGCGWRFSYPTIENRQNSDGSTYKYIHTESGDIYRMLGPTVVNNVNTYTLENHPVKDVEIKENTTFSSYGTNVIGTRYTMTSKYLMTEKNGKKTYFDPDGRILGIVDRYGNTIRFEYVNFKYDLSEGAITKVLISKIIDTVGREVNIEYKENPDFHVTGYDPNTNTADSDLRYYFQVIILLPNEKTIVYDKSCMGFRIDTLHNVRCRLQRVYGVDAALPINDSSQIKTSLSYEKNKLGWTYFNGTTYNRALKNTYENIDSTYDYMNKKRKDYIYGTYKKRLNTGSMEYRKVTIKKDIDYLDGSTKDQNTYVYINEPDGFGYAGYNADDDNYLKNTYRYYTEKTDMRGAKVKYTYDGKAELINVEDYGNDHKEVTTTTYDANKLPQKKVREVYDVVNGQTTAGPIRYVENYVFDNFGNLTSYTDALANRDANDTPTDGEHTTAYTYATDKYHILTSKTWKRDAGTTSRIEYDVDASGNVTQERRTRFGNNIVADCLYDSYGNMTKKTVHYADNSGNTYITNYEYGTDANNVDQKGAYLTKEYSTVDGVEIAKKYTYDFYTGNMKDTYDENNSKVSYTYDVLNRVTQITYPDATTKQYNYDNFRSERQIIFTDQKRQSSHYYYDIFGNLIILFKAGITTVQIEYDSNNNKTKEIDANGHSTRYTYDSANRLIRKSFWENDATEKKYMSLSYTVAASPNNTPLLVTITDEEGYAKKYYYDKLNRLNQLDVTPDKTSFYSRLYTLDNVGNIVKVKDNRGNYTYNYYDNLNRLFCVRDAVGGETLYYYDAGDKITQTINARGITTCKEFDGLGRLLRTKVPNSDGSICITRYIYDKAGNIIKEINPRYYDAAKDTPALAQTMTGVSYTYNNMNRLVSTLSPEGTILEYRKYDENGNLQKVVDGLRYNGNVDTSPGAIYNYDAFNRVTKVYNALNQMSKQNVYDNVGNLINQYDGNNNQTQYDYNPDRTLQKVTYPDGGTIQYTYDKLGRKLTQTDQLGNTTTYTYNSFGMQTATDTLGRYTKNYYDPNGNITKVETLRDSGKYDVNKYEYDSLNRLTRSICLVDESDIYNAAALPNIANLRDSDYPGTAKIITGYEYDPVGNKTKTIDPRAYGYLYSDTTNRDKFTVWYTYDPSNRLEKTTRKYNGANVYSQIHYDIAGNKDWVKDERGLLTNYSYDNMNRLLTVKDPLNKTTTYGYDLLGNLTTVTNAKGTTTYGYDTLNRLETETDPTPRLISKKAYDANNNVIKQYDAKGYLNGYYTTYTYDSMNRLQTVIDPEMRAKYGTSKNTLKYEYNKAGQKTKTTDALGNITQYGYDPAGRLTGVTDAGNNITSYAYDQAGNRLYTQYAINGGNKKTNYSYGAFGLLKSTTNADNLSTSCQYDLALNTAAMTDRNGNTTLYTYDLMKKMLSRSVARTGDSVTYEYDPAGNRKNMTDATGTTSYNYYNNNWLKDVVKDGVTQVHYQYDDAGNITSVTDKKSFTTSYNYDSNSRMLTVTFSGKTTTYAYDENGNRQSVTYPGGMKEEYTYNKNNKLLTLTNKNPGGSAISSYSYTYWDNGLQKSKTDSYGTTTYTYYPTGQIKTVTAPGKTTVYTYDGAGNRKSASETYISDQTYNEVKYRIKNSQYLYTETSRLISLLESMQDSNGAEKMQRKTIYTYDNNGNQLRTTVETLKPWAAGVQELAKAGAYSDNITQPLDSTVESTDNTYDGFNRLKRTETIKSGNRAVTEYAYNGNDLRTQKTVKKSNAGYAPEVTNYLYNGSQVILETDASNSVKTRYIQGINYICQIDSANKISYFMYNGHGDVVQTAAENGTVENQYDYDIFGAPALATEQYACAVRYAGEFYDSENGLYYLRARYYDSYTARFVTEDSYTGQINDPLSLNLYTYCANDPINMIDPSGHGKVWNRFGEVVGTTSGNDYTDNSQKATETHGGGAQASVPWTSSSSSSGSSKGSSSSGSSSKGSNSSGSKNSSSSGSSIISSIPTNNTSLSKDYSNAVWNNYGEVIGYNPLGFSYTDRSQEALDIHGGGAQAHKEYRPSSSLVSTNTKAAFDVEGFKNFEFQFSLPNMVVTLQSQGYSRYDITKNELSPEEIGELIRQRDFIAEAWSHGIICIPSSTKTSGDPHLALDIAGFYPGLGAIADGINCIMYLKEGDKGNAALSATAIMPIVGDIAAGSKIGAKGIKAIGKAGSVTKGAGKVDILSNKKLTNQTGKVNNYESATKGFDAAKADFNALKPSDVKTYPNGTTVGKLPDGTTINVRPSSSGRYPTVEIYNPTTGTSTKIRY